MLTSALSMLLQDTVLIIRLSIAPAGGMSSKLSFLHAKTNFHVLPTKLSAISIPLDCHVPDLFNIPDIARLGGGSVLVESS